MITKATRAMTGVPVSSIDVRLGRHRDGTPAVAIDGHKYRAIPLPIVDPAMIRELIADLEVAAAHLENE